MNSFIQDYVTKLLDGTYALDASFISVTALFIYVGELPEALLTAPINDKWERKTFFISSSFSIIAGTIV